MHSKPRRVLEMQLNIDFWCLLIDIKKRKETSRTYCQEDYGV